MGDDGRDLGEWLKEGLRVTGGEAVWLTRRQASTRLLAPRGVKRTQDESRGPAPAKRNMTCQEDIRTIHHKSQEDVDKRTSKINQE